MSADIPYMTGVYHSKVPPKNIGDLSGMAAIRPHVGTFEWPGGVRPRYLYILGTRIDLDDPNTSSVSLTEGETLVIDFGATNAATEFYPKAEG